MSTSSTDSASTAQDLPVPDYLHDKSYDDKTDRLAISALNIHATGRLSLRPCRLCVADGKDCIVSPTKSSRCAWCSFKSMKIRECLAEGVKHNNNAPIPTSQTPNSAAPTLSICQPPPPATAAVPKLTMSSPTTDNAGNSASAANADSNASMPTNNSSSNADRDTATQKKRKRSDSDPADVDADATAPKRPSPTATGAVSAPGSARATMDGLAGTIRLAPNGAVNYDLTIRDKDPVAWAQFAKDLYKETQTLRHVQDLGLYTMCIIRMMDEDGVWPQD